MQWIKYEYKLLYYVHTAVYYYVHVYCDDSVSVPSPITSSPLQAVTYSLANKALHLSKPSLQQFTVKNVELRRDTKKTNPTIVEKS